MQAIAQQRVGMRAFAAPARPARGCVRVQAAKTSLAGLVRDIQQDGMKKDVKKVDIGDTVRIGLAVVEGKGKTRTQTVEGTIISQQGSGVNKTVTFRRIFQGVGMELTLPVHAPAVQSMEVVRHGRVRRAKLYYLRDRIGKAARLKEVVGAAATKRAAADAAAAAATQSK